jgi:hypothetical protein
MKIRNILFAVILLTLNAGAFGQVSIIASVDKNIVEVDEPVMLRVTVGGPADTLKPEMPSMPSFNVYDYGFQTSVVTTPGGSLANLTYTFKLIPRFAGNAEIGPIKVSYGGAEFSTDPISISVYRKGEKQGANPAAVKPPVAAKPADKAGTQSGKRRVSARFSDGGDGQNNGVYRRADYIVRIFLQFRPSERHAHL